VFSIGLTTKVQPDSNLHERSSSIALRRGDNGFPQRHHVVMRIFCLHAHDH